MARSIAAHSETLPCPRLQLGGPTTRRSHAWGIGVSTVAVAILGLYLLRLLEHPEVDQSLFSYYGHWILRGYRLYADLWDSKPPGIFVVYGLAGILVGARFAAGLLMLLAATLSSVLTYHWVRSALNPGTSLFCALLAATLWSAPAFGGALSTAQAEVLMAPLLISTALLSGGSGGRRAFSAGVLLGLAFSLKIVAALLLPLAWLFAPARERWSVVRARAVVLGFLLVPAMCAAGLALHGVLGDAMDAVLLYPRAYASEIMHRIALLPALGTAGWNLLRGLPLTILLALVALVSGHRVRLVRQAAGWLLIATVAAASQRLMSTYHLLLLAPPLAVLGGFGALRIIEAGRGAWKGSQKLDLRASLLLVLIAGVVGWAGAQELRLWARHYSPHLERALGRLDDESFISRQGPAGERWLESEEIGGLIRERSHPRHTLLVWGLAPAVYLNAGCPPATRYAFHQTLLVQGSALSTRWPDAKQRQQELLERMQAQPPEFVVIVRGDRNGFEPLDSEAELLRFPALANILEHDYGFLGGTGSYTLLVHKAASQE